MATEPASLLVRAGRTPFAKLPKAATFTLGQLAGLLGFLALPVTVGFVPGMNGSLVFRAILAGVICGLGAAGYSALWTALSASVVAMLGAVVVVLAIPGMGAGWILGSVLIAAVVAPGAAWAASAGLRKAVVAATLLVLCVMMFWVAGFLGGPFAQAVTPFHQSIAVEPATESYAFDGAIFIRTYFLVDKGVPYYEAFTKAFVEDSRLSVPPPTKFGYRQPLLYWVWAALPGSNGVSLLAWFCALACAAMIGSYLLASRFVRAGPALIAPAMLLTYFAWPTISTWFALSEFWAGALGVLCISALVRRRWLLAALFLVAAVAVRELMVYLIPVFGVAWILYARRREEIPAIVLAVLGPITVLALHLRFAPRNSPGAGSFDITPWLHGNLAHMTSSLKFSGDFVLGGPNVHLAIAVIAAVAALLVAPLWRKALLFLLVIVPVLAFLRFGMNEWEYYWGAITMPIVLSLVPVLLTPFLPSERALRDAHTPRSAKSKVRVVVPVRDASATITDAVQGLAGALEAEKVDYAILVADDHSSDGTADAAQKAGAGHSVSVRRGKKDAGYAATLLAALRAASAASKPGDLVMVVDGASAIAPESAIALLRRGRLGAPAVVGSRLALRSHSSGLSLAQSLGARASAWFARAFLPVEGCAETASAWRLYDAELLAAALARYSDILSRAGDASIDVALGQCMRDLASCQSEPISVDHEKLRAAIYPPAPSFLSQTSAALSLRWAEAIGRARA